LLYDTNRGTGKYLSSDTTTAETTNATTLTSFNSNGFSLGVNASYNGNGTTYASWTFRKAAKFFDVVTWTGNGTAGRTIAHNLSSVPGCIIVKRTDTSANWAVYHRASAKSGYTPEQSVLSLNLTNAVTDDSQAWNNTAPTTSVFTVGSDSKTNASGGTYVAYLFAHDAGGFGDAGTDSVVSCGSYTGNTTTPPFVNCGFEPQWVLVRAATTGSDWLILDNMRGVFTGSADEPFFEANTSGAESTNVRLAFNATGFTPEGGGTATSADGETHIYIAIRRGPMKTPTVGTEVFHAKVARDASSTTVPSYSAPFNVDLAFSRFRIDGQENYIGSRLQGLRKMDTTVTSAESASTDFAFDYQTGWGNIGGASSNFISWMFRRAPGFFDVVCYTGTSVARTVTHNLAAVPELMIVKDRTASASWVAYSASTGPSICGSLNSTSDFFNVGTAYFNSTVPTSSLVTIGANGTVNASGNNYVAYLFATLAGVSKVGSYTGTGTTLSIDCGFTAGARFVLIKRTDSSGDWYVWDTARGIISGNDPYLLLNSTAAEVTNTDYIDPLSSGFQISSTAPAAINASGGSFIFLAIA